MVNCSAESFNLETPHPPLHRPLLQARKAYAVQLFLADASKYLVSRRCLPEGHDKCQDIAVTPAAPPPPPPTCGQ